MADSRSIEIFKGIKDAEQKLDYFFLSLSCALFAYIGAQYKPMPLSFSQNTFELISITLFFISIIAGFKRLDFNITIMRLNFQKLDMGERKGAITQALITPGSVLNIEKGEVLDRNEAEYTLQVIEENEPKVKAKLSTYFDYSSASFLVRNVTLMLGFVVLGGSKFIGVYVVSVGV